MKLFIHYLKDRLFFIMIYVVSVLICLCVFKLYNLELEAFTYAFMILCVLLVVCFLFDYYKYYKKHQTLVTLQSNSNVSLSCDLQDSSLMGEDYHEILVAMKEYHDEYVISSENKMHDLEDYFTMWVHQAKLPIAAMKLLLEDDKLSRSEIKLQLLRMDQYTDMVLAYLRLNSTHTDFLFKELELDDLIRQSIRRFSTEFIRKHIQLSFKETGDVILSDEKWLVFVLEQILSNSLKYTKENGCNGVQREHNKKLNNGLPILHKVPPKRDYGRYFCIMAEKGGTSHGGLTEKLSLFFHAKKQEVNAYGR